MKKGKYILTITILVALGLWYYISQSKNTVQNEFNIATSSNLFDVIKLTDKSDTILLQNKNGEWFVNNTIKASKLKVKLMLDVLQSLNVKNPVTGPAGEDIRKIAKENGVSITCFQNEKKNYQISLLSNSGKLKGDFAIKSNNRYVMQVFASGHKESLQELFSTDIKYWQSNTIFSFSPEQINQIKVDWKDEGESFIIENNEESREIWINKENITSNADLNKLKFYLYEFQNIEWNSVGDHYRNQQGEFICQIELLANDHSISAKFYEMVAADGVINKKLMVVYIPVSNTWGTINYIKMTPIMKKASFFLQTEAIKN